MGKLPSLIRSAPRSLANRATPPPPIMPRPPRRSGPGAQLPAGARYGRACQPFPPPAELVGHPRVPGGGADEGPVVVHDILDLEGEVRKLGERRGMGPHIEAFHPVADRIAVGESFLIGGPGVVRSVGANLLSKSISVSDPGIERSSALSRVFSCNLALRPCNSCPVSCISWTACARELLRHVYSIS